MFRCLIGAAVAVTLASLNRAPAGEPLTRELLLSALHAFGVRQGAVVAIGTGRYRIERLAVEPREVGRFVIDVTTRGE